MYSEHGLDAWIRSVLAEVCQSLIVVSYWMPGSPQRWAASAILPEDVLGLVGLHRRARRDDGVGRPVLVVDDGLHELVRHADGVVGVLEVDASRTPRR